MTDQTKVEKKALDKKTFAVQLIYFIVGISFYVLALRLFFVDNHIAAGGLSGIATVLSFIFPVSVGNLIFLMNLPLILIAIKIMGWRYALRTMLGMTCFAMLLNLAAFIPAITEDRLAAAVFGGIFNGFGAVALLRAKASAGGTDLISRLLLRKFRHLSLGKMFMIIDGFCVVLAVIVYGNLESGVYALTAILVFSYSIDRIISGFNVADICFIVTSRPTEEMAQEIMQKLHVGVTRQQCTGMYAKTERSILMVVVRPREIQRLKDIIQKHDPDAFLAVAWAREVLGGGFRVVSDQS